MRRGVRVGGLGERVSSGIPVEEEKGPEKGEAGGVGTIEVGDGPAAIGTAISTREGWLGYGGVFCIEKGREGGRARRAG